MHPRARVYVAGHRGLAGSAIVRALHRADYSHLITRTHDELELTHPEAVNHFFSQERPEYVLIAAGKVGGIEANNTYPADFLMKNLSIVANLIEASYAHNVKRLLFLGSSCIYPRLCPQPIREEYLLSGPLEPTNRPYAIAKIAGIEMCWSFNRQFGSKYLSVMPTNLYGPNDNFNKETSHVMAALIRRTIEAQMEGSGQLVVWGTGTPRREFMHSDDLAEACRLLLESDSPYEELVKPEISPLINIGTGEDITIRELAELIAREVGFKGEIVFDSAKPDGTPQKLLDVTRIRDFGWRPRVRFEDGVRSAIAEFRHHAEMERELNRR